MIIKTIIFDFDGVILDSIPIKTEAFKKLFAQFDSQSIDKLIKYHIQNGGKSRYVKIKYFFEEILNTNINEEKINQYAEKYSQLTKEELSNSKYLIQDTLNFIKKNYEKYNLYVASGADENDLKYICNELGLSRYFSSINGSPQIKSDIVSNILQKNNYKKEETILIGDSLNDYDAANLNNIKFYGYNNKKLKLVPNIAYINQMDTFEKDL